MRIVTVMVLSGLLVVASTGCVSKSQHQHEVSVLQGQVSQMDAALKAQQQQNQTLQTQLDSLRGPRAGAVPEYKDAMYRTPSGFELSTAEIQKALKGAGYYSGASDGKMGPDSREALRNFQRDNGLKADGVCGKQTWAKLKTHLNVAG